MGKKHGNAIVHLTLLSKTFVYVAVVLCALTQSQKIFAADGLAKIQLPTLANLAFQAKGKIKGISYTANANLSWQHNGHTYQAQQSIKTMLLGTRSQTSRGNIQGEFLQPNEFEDSAKPKRNLRFDYAQRMVKSGDEQNPAQTFPVGAQDRLSVFFQLASMVANRSSSKAIVDGTIFSIWTVAHNKQENWLFKVTRQEQMTLPVGKLNAVCLERTVQNNNDKQAEICLSPDINYLPVQIYLGEDNGDNLVLRLKSSQ